MNDFAQSLDLALQLSLTRADLLDDEAARVAAYAESAAVWGDAVNRLERFAQPGARGWAADLAEARVRWLDARTAAASARGDQRLARALSAQRSDLAARQLELREADFDRGLATATELAEAAVLLPRPSKPQDDSGSGTRRTDAATLRRRLRQIDDEIERWSRAGAELGRPDRLQLARARLSLAEARLSGASGNENSAVAAADRAERRSVEAFETRVDQFAQGTTSLAELADAWRSVQSARDTRDEFREKSDAEPPTDGESATRPRPELEWLVGRAEATIDRRGRRAADVAFIHAMKAAESLRTWKAASEESGESGSAQ